MQNFSAIRPVLRQPSQKNSWGLHPPYTERGLSKWARKSESVCFRLDGDFLGSSAEMCPGERRHTWRARYLEKCWNANMYGNVWRHNFEKDRKVVTNRLLLIEWSDSRNVFLNSKCILLWRYERTVTQQSEAAFLPSYIRFLCRRNILQSRHGTHYSLHELMIDQIN